MPCLLPPEELHKKVNQGQFLILEGASAAAESFGSSQREERNRSQRDRYS